MSAEAKFNGSILILGSSGKVGVPTVHALIAQKVPNVHLLVRDEEKAKKTLGLPADSNVKLVKGDLYDLSSVEAALKGVDRVFLIHPNGDPKNIDAVAKLAKAANVKLFVHLSALGADSSAPKNTIQYNHAKGEDAVDAAGLPYVFLRPTYFFQNWLDEAASIKTGAIYRPELKHAFSNIDARDIADAAVTLLTAADPSKHVGRTYFLTTDPLTFDGVAKTISAAIGKEVKLVTVGDADWYYALQQHGMPEPFAWILLKLHQQTRTTPADAIFGDFKILTGKEPRKFADYIAENKAAFL